MPSRSASPKSARAVEVLVVEAGFEASHERSARLHVLAKLLALAVAEHRDIGQQQHTILGKPFGIEAVFVHEIERETASKQRVIDAMRRLVHVGA